MKVLKTFLLLVICVGISICCSPQAAAQGVSVSTNQMAEQSEYRFLSTNKTSTMESELNGAAAQGFRLERFSKSFVDSNLAALVVRAPGTPSKAQYEYKVLATRKVSTLESELTEAANQGFESRGITSIERALVGSETIIVMERPAGVTKRRVDYKLLSTKREKTMQKELDAAVSEGYVPFEVILNKDTTAASLLLGPSIVYTVMLSREADGQASGQATREYKFLSTNKVSTMEKEMNRSAADGYRFSSASPGLLTLMYRDKAGAKKAQYEYKLLATRKTSTMQKELLEEGLLGFSYLATTDGLGGLATVLERDQTTLLKENRHEYKMLTTLREQTTQKEIGQSLAEGYQLLDLTTVGEFVVVLGRQADRKATLKSQ